jgi:hypothetical protein
MVFIIQDTTKIKIAIIQPIVVFFVGVAYNLMRMTEHVNKRSAGQPVERQLAYRGNRLFPGETWRRVVYRAHRAFSWRSVTDSGVLGQRSDSQRFFRRRVVAESAGPTGTEIHSDAVPSGDRTIMNLASYILKKGGLRGDDIHLTDVRYLEDHAERLWNDLEFQDRMRRRGVSLKFDEREKDSRIAGADYANIDVGIIGYSGALEFATGPNTQPKFSLIPAGARWPVTEMTPEKLFEEYLFADEIRRGLDGNRIVATAEPLAGGHEFMDYNFGGVKIGHENYIRLGFTFFPSETGGEIAPVFYIPKWTLTINSEENIQGRASRLLEYVNEQATAAYRDGRIVREGSAGA